MNILAIDTSTRILSLAVAKDGKVLKFSNRKLHRPLSSSIMPSIKDILDRAGIALKKIDGFAVGLGPGSFTSLRVGLSTVKGLAFSADKPVVGISSLDVLAMNAPQDHGQVCTICDAKRDLVYACLYEKKGIQLKKKLGYSLEGIHDILKQLKGEVIFIGDGIELYRDDILKAKGIVPTFVEEGRMMPQAKHLALLSMALFQKGKKSDIDKLVPLYMYPEHCQVRKS